MFVCFYFRNIKSFTKKISKNDFEFLEHSYMKFFINVLNKSKTKDKFLDLF